MGTIEPHQFLLGNKLHQHFGCQVQLCECQCQQIICRPNKEPTPTMDDWIRLVRNHAADKSASELNPSERERLGLIDNSNHYCISSR